jgi:hypothetical protein
MELKLAHQIKRNLQWKFRLANLEHSQLDLGFVPLELG